jgi:flagellar basal-body rod modification protein FlgD
MIDLTGIGAAKGSGTTSTSTAKSTTMGQDEFLKMFMAQMKNQDPLNPMQGSDMAAQLAQFSSVEQLTKVNTNLESMKSSQDESTRLDALNFIGKEIVASGNALSLEEGKVAEGRFDLSESAQCSVLIKNSSGTTVGSFSLGTLGPGAHTFQWSGHDSSGNLLSPGTYNFQVMGKTSAGKIVSGDPRVSGKVTGVNLENGGVKLNIGEVPVGISEVMDIITPVAPEGS